MASKYNIDEDEAYRVTKHNLNVKSARDIPYVAWNEHEPREANTQVLGTGRTYKQRQTDKILRNRGVGVFDRGEEDPIRIKSQREIQLRVDAHKAARRAARRRSGR